MFRRILLGGCFLVAFGVASVGDDNSAEARRHGCYGYGGHGPRFHGQTWGAPRYRAWSGSPYHRMHYGGYRGMIGGNPMPW